MAKIVDAVNQKERPILRYYSYDIFNIINCHDNKSLYVESDKMGTIKKYNLKNQKVFGLIASEQDGGNDENWFGYYMIISYQFNQN